MTVLVAVALAAAFVGSVAADGGAARAAGGRGVAQAHAARALAALPVGFAVNRGQFDPRVRFAASGAGFGLALTDQGPVVALSRTAHSGARAGVAGKGAKTQSVAVRIGFVGGHGRLVGAGRLPGVANYLIGARSRWRRHVPTFSDVRYVGVWRGVNASVSSTGGALRFDFRLAVGASARSVRLGFAGVKTVRVADSGDLVLKMTGGGSHWTSWLPARIS